MHAVVKTTAATLGLVLGFAGTTAFAGTLEEPVIAAAPVAAAPAFVGGNWDGFYGGAQLGYGDLDGDDLGDDDGAIGGLHAGWQTSTNRIVYGVEGDVNATDLSFGSTDLDSLSHVKAKLGYDLGRSLVYATAGGAYADFDGGSSDWGYAVGVGYDYLITDNISLGAEAVYHEFDDFDGSGSDIDGTTFTAKVAYHF